MAINYDVEYPKLQGCVAELQAKLHAVERLTRYNCVRGLAGGRVVEPDPTGQFILVEDLLKALQEKEG